MTRDEADVLFLNPDDIIVMGAEVTAIKGGLGVLKLMGFDAGDPERRERISTAFWLNAEVVKRLFDDFRALHITIQSELEHSEGNQQEGKEG